jgi:hypothetical protein
MGEGARDFGMGSRRRKEGATVTFVMESCAQMRYVLWIFGMGSYAQVK